MKRERERILAKQASPQVQHMFATSFGLSEKFSSSSRLLGPAGQLELLKDELSVPSYGANTAWTSRHARRARRHLVQE
jgi:acetone carboxylase alpha subunit